MPSDLKEKIYQAQCLGNIQPIEHMVPYPNLRALVDGQNIKYGQKLVYTEHKLTSDKVYSMAQQTANWLVSMGILPKERILVDQLPFPQNEILAFGIWTLGASMVLVGDQNIADATINSAPSLIINSDVNYFDREENYMEADTAYLGCWRKSDLVNLGGFNEEFQINEDYELNIRIRKSGKLVTVNENLEVSYYVRNSLFGLVKQFFRYGLWKTKTLSIHPDSLKKWASKI